MSCISLSMSRMKQNVHIYDLQAQIVENWSFQNTRNALLFLFFVSFFSQRFSLPMSHLRWELSWVTFNNLLKMFKHPVLFLCLNICWKEAESVRCRELRWAPTELLEGIPQFLPWLSSPIHPVHPKPRRVFGCLCMCVHSNGRGLLSWCVLTCDLMPLLPLLPILRNYQWVIVILVRS